MPRQYVRVPTRVSSQEAVWTRWLFRAEAARAAGTRPAFEAQLARDEALTAAQARAYADRLWQAIDVGRQLQRSNTIPPRGDLHRNPHLPAVSPTTGASVAYRTRVLVHMRRGSSGPVHYAWVNVDTMRAPDMAAVTAQVQDWIDRNVDPHAGYDPRAPVAGLSVMLMDVRSVECRTC